MEYLSSSSGIQNILIQPSQQLIIKNYQPDIKKSYISNSLVSISRPNPRNASLTYGNSFLIPNQSKNMGLRSWSALDSISINSSLSSKRRATRMQYNSIDDPHLKEYFEKKFKLSHAKKKRFKERKLGPNEIIYKVKVKTGNYNNASTDANVYLTLNGKRGDIPRTQLFNKYNAIRTEKGYKFKFERNSVNTFKVIGIDVGSLAHITIEHDGVDIHSSWFLQEISITNTKTHRSWLFECNDWLSRDHGLYKTRVTLVPTRELEKYAETEYKIITVTGDKPDASTDANVYITLFGTRNKYTQKLPLKNPNKNLFERGQSDVFKFNTNYVGPIQKVRIEHDNSGQSPGWFLERIVVCDLKDPKVNYYCPCGKWLDKNKDDGLISRDLLATDDLSSIKKIGKYKITVYTGDHRGASTDADVKITLYGNLGDSGECKLDNNKNNFERGKIDEFMIECPNIGEINKLKIGHNNKGPGSGWFLSKVIVDDLTLNRIYEFVCERWLAKDEDDGKTTVFLYPSRGSRSGTAQPGVPYIIYVYTGDKSNAGTDAKVFIELFGGKSGNESSGRIELNEGKFERNMIDKINIDTNKMLSPLSKILIGHDNSSMSPGWFLSKVEVECPSIGMKQVFPCEKWLAKDEDDGKIERILKENTSLRQVRKSQTTWYVWVYTSNLKHAGTDSNVSIVLYGDKGKSDDIKLKSDKSSFESGKCDEFKIETNDIGQPFKLRVFHDNSGSFPGWHLDRIELENMATKERYFFTCNRWLSKDEDDKQIVRELPAEAEFIRKPLKVVKYTVEVHTGDKRNAGTDANVFINIFGDLGDTGERSLERSETNKNSFERAQIDVFKIEAVTLKQLKKIRIGHNGKGAGAGWFLNKVVVKQDDNPKYDQTFECNRWLAIDEDDGLIVRELFADGQQFLDTITYHVKVKTGDVRNAGTDARVSLKIFGDKGHSDFRHLNSSDNTSNKFERNRLDEFRIEAEDFGKIEMIKVKHNGKGLGSGWFLDYIEIDVPSSGLSYKFSAHRWLDENEGDGLTEIDLYPTEVRKGKRLIPYVIKTKTGDKRNAGTDANVFVQLYGLDGKSEEIFLDNKGDNFERGKEDIFKIEADDVGPIFKIRIGHDNKTLNSGWFLDNLKIERHAIKGSKLLKKSSSHNNNETENYYFFVNKWFAKDEDDGQIVRELIATDENGRPLMELDEVPYEVKVFTGDKSGAGTDARVFLTVYGLNGDSGERELKKSENLNKFERNQVDTFKLKAIELGELQKVKIRHDDTGGGSAWYLEKLEIYNPSTNKSYLFNCQNWLATDLGDGKICRELPAIDPEQIKRVKFRQGAKNLKDQFLLETEGITLVFNNLFKNMDKDKLFGKHYIDEALTTTYNVSVITSDIRNAGTDSNVFIQLFGEKNDSGKITLETSKTNRNKFERGQTDVFEIKEADVGDIQKIRIGHDGRNVGAGWHLQEVIIDAPKLGKKWRFACGRWLDKNEEDGKIEIDLYPIKMSNEKYTPYVPYEITVYTSDLRNADTSANPFICIYGEEIHTEQVELCKNKAERKDKFKRGAIDKFVIELDDVGKKIRKIRIGHDNKGITPGWHLDKVEIRRLKDSGKGSKIFTFPCGRWLARDEDDRAIERDLVATKIIDENFENGQYNVKEKEARNQLEIKKYIVEVYTGNESGAGTDANVFLTVFGELGDTGEKKLIKSETHSNKFERNQMDRFIIESADLGVLYKIKIRHDNAGLFGSDWFLDRVEIIDDYDRNKYVFLCDRWLSKSKEDKQIERTLFEKSYKGPKNNSSSALKSNIGSSQIIGSNTKLSSRQNSPFSNRSNDAFDGPTIPYKIKIRTGDEKNCGISSQVYIRLFGENKKKKTEKMILQPAKNRRFEPGSVEIFQIDEMDIGNLAQIEIGHDGVGPKQSWFVKDIEVQDTVNGKTYMITCNQWLSTEHGDGLTLRRFNVDSTTQITSYRGLIPYNVKICTGDMARAGTDSSVTLKFFGTKGNSSDIFIEKMENRFDRGSEDDLMIELDDIGSLKKVRVSIDGKGSRREWFLDRIEATNMKTRKTYLFVAQDWLSKAKKGSLSIDIPLFKDGRETIGTTDYKLTVKTSDVSGAGTDANVFVTIFGENGDSGEVELKKSETNINKFEKNRTDVFTISNILSLGELTKLRIRHDNSGSIIGNSHWHLEYVKIEDLQQNKTYMFNCNKWLSLSKDDKQLVRELTPEMSENMKNSPIVGDRTTYEITVITADEPNAGTNQNAFIVLIGENNQESKLKLFENNFERKILRRGQEDKFSFKTKSVGNIKKIILGHAARNDEPINSKNEFWICEEVIIHDLNTGNTYLVPVRDTLILNNEPKAYKCKSSNSSMLNITRQLKNVNYEVTVHTGQSGTGAKVYINIFGEHGDTGKRPLKGSFDKDDKEKFSIQSLDLGKIKKIIIEHDNSGFRKNWFLKEIEIRDESGQVLLFPCNKWLSKEKEDGEIARELYPLLNEENNRRPNKIREKKMTSMDEFNFDNYYNKKEKSSFSKNDRDIYYR